MALPPFLPSLRDHLSAVRLSRRAMVAICGAIVAVLGLCLAAYALWLPAQGFPTGSIVHVPEDAGVHQIAAALKAAGAIRSPLVFYGYTRITGIDRSLGAGPFAFEKPLGLASVAHRLARGEHGIIEKRVTLTEGMTVADMGAAIAAEVPSFDAARFRDLGEPLEGYLFPDTYFFLPDLTPEEAVARLRARFDERIETIRPELDDSGRSIGKLVILASILEREANRPDDMRLVAGILENRLAIDMPLQVDAVFGYIRGENGYTPTAADLESDSPYNTYRYQGLPPGPIANPGLEALRAAADPTETDYLYYLTGKDGLMYYGVTFDDHRKNRARYLDI